jgi:hypothetical protein
MAILTTSFFSELDGLFARQEYTWLVTGSTFAGHTISKLDLAMPPRQIKNL